MSNEIERIFQGIRDIQETNPFFFIHRQEVLKDFRITYFCIVCGIRPHKKKALIVRLTVGGDKLIYDGPVSTLTSDLPTSKLHRNSVISTPASKYFVVYVKYFYLKDIMVKHEYYSISISLITQEVIDEYNLMDKKTNGLLYVRAEKGMYWLVQALIIAHMAINEHL